MSRRLRAFKRWMLSQKIDCSNALKLTDCEDGISVKALGDLKEGDLVATIPKSSCLTIKTSAGHQIIDDAHLEGSLGLSFALMYERSLGADSAWDGYLQLLPERECVPLVWSLEEVDTLLSGTELHQTVKDDKNFLYEDWKECILPLIESGPLKVDSGSFDIEQYFAARSLVASRSFEIDDYHGSGMVPLADLFNHKTGAENVHFTYISSHSESENDNDSDHDGEYGNINDNKPSADDLSTDSPGDALNHLNTDTCSSKSVAGLNSSDIGIGFSSNAEDYPKTLEMIIVKEVKEGDEVFNTYGSMGNAALLHRYGFTEPDNPFDIVNIDLDLVMQSILSSFSDRYYRSRVSLWRRLGCTGCISQNAEYFEISSCGEPQLELLILLYIIFLPEEAYQKLNNTIPLMMNVDKSVSFILSTKNGRRGLPETQDKEKGLLLTASVCSALVSLADIRESFYGSNSLEDDMKALKKCCRLRERKLYHSLVLRVSERIILKKLRLHASRSSRIRNGARRRRGKVKGRCKRSLVK